MKNLEIVVSFSERICEGGHVVNDQGHQDDQWYDYSGRRDVIQTSVNYKKQPELSLRYLFKVKISKMFSLVQHGSWQSVFQALRSHVIDFSVSGEWTAVPGRFDPDEGVADGQHAEKQHRQQQR